MKEWSKQMPEIILLLKNKSHNLEAWWEALSCACQRATVWVEVEINRGLCHSEAGVGKKGHRMGVALLSNQRQGVSVCSVGRASSDPRGTHPHTAGSSVLTPPALGAGCPLSGLTLPVPSQPGSNGQNYRIFGKTVQYPFSSVVFLCSSGPSFSPAR